MKIAYIINARLPTELAHGHQTVRMCAAFAKVGATVLLLYPRRRQTPEIGSWDIFDYYDIPRSFEARAIFNIDTIYWFETHLPRSWDRWIHAVHSVLWGSYATFVAWRAGADRYYTRDMIIAWLLTAGRFSTAYEEHALPTRRAEWLLAALGKRASLRLSVAVTSFIRNRLIHIGFRPNAVITLPDAVDLSLFKDLPSKEVCRTKIGLSHKGFIIGYVGRFRVFGTEEKGIFELIEAAAIIAREHDVMVLLVGGPAEATAAYTTHARACGLPMERLRIVGHVSPAHVPEWMRACDTLVIPWHFTPFSAYATSPLKLFEYMASGVPIVASDLPSLREIVNDESVVFVRPGSAPDLARGITRLLMDSNLCQRLSSRAREGVASHTWIKRAERIILALL